MKTLPIALGALATLAVTSNALAHLEYSTGPNNGAGNSDIWAGVQSQARSTADVLVATTGLRASSNITGTTWGRIRFFSGLKEVFYTDAYSFSVLETWTGGAIKTGGARTVRFMGNDIVRDGATTANKSYTYQPTPFSQSTTFYSQKIPIYDLLIFSIDLTVGVKGRVSLAPVGTSLITTCYQTTTVPVQGTICVVPGHKANSTISTNSSAAIYATANAQVGLGVDTGIFGYVGARAGATVSVDLLKATANPGGYTQLYRVNGKDAVAWDARSLNQLSALSGKFELWADYMLGSDRETVINWAGFTFGTQEQHNKGSKAM